MNRTNVIRTVVSAGLVLGLAAPQFAAEPRRLTLTEAVHLAVSQNRALKIARLKVVENEQKKVGARSEYFPSITNHSEALHSSEIQNIQIPAGALGTVGGALVTGH